MCIFFLSAVCNPIIYSIREFRKAVKKMLRKVGVCQDSDENDIVWAAESCEKWQGSHKPVCSPPQPRPHSPSDFSWGEGGSVHRLGSHHKSRPCIAASAIQDFTDEKCAVLRNCERNSNCVTVADCIYERRSLSQMDRVVTATKHDWITFSSRIVNLHWSWNFEIKSHLRHSLYHVLLLLGYRFFYPERIVHCHLGRRKEWKEIKFVTPEADWLLVTQNNQLRNRIT